METVLANEFEKSKRTETSRDSITEADLSNARILLPPKMVHLVNDDGWHLFFDPEYHVWVRLNESGKEIIESLETRSCVDEVINDLAIRYNVKPVDIRDQVLSFVRGMVEAGIVHLNQYVSRKVAYRLSGDHPYAVYFSNTERCDLSCVYCYNAESRKRQENKNKEMTTSDTKKAFDILKDFGVSLIAFCGGEPMFRPDLFEVARYAKDEGFFIALVTNGTLITEKNASSTAELFDLVWVSLDSTTKEEHEALRGKGSFDRTMKAVRLIAQNKPKRFIVNSVTCKLNVKSMPETHRILTEEIGVDLHRMSAYMPTKMPIKDKNGRPVESILFDDEYRDIMVNAGLKLELGGDELPPIEIDRLDGLIVKKANRKIQCGFASGDIHMVSNGDIYPCVMMYKEEFKCGNILTGDIKKIYRGSDIMKKCREATVDNIKECEGCFVKYICAGGCRGTAYEMYGDLNAYHKDLCPLLQKSAIDSMWLDTKIPLDKMKEAVVAYKQKLRELDETESSQVAASIQESY